ncbi:MAG: hypothetical protein IIZ14_01870, partial [Solobacterium sp.]|nr:hypothetical protein [Solobacterium sp.]
TDEHFYLAVADRVARGDAMLYDLWDIGQLMVFFTFPLVKLYRTVWGGTQGIVLAFRCVYTAMTMAIGAGIYLKFRKDTPWAVLASAIFMLYTPFNIMAPSYNTLAIGFLMTGLLVYPRDHRSAARLWLCGVMMAAAVLNSPYFLLMYGFLTVVMIRNRKIVPLCSWLWITAGAVSLAIVFLGFVLSRAPLSGILSVLPNLVDPEHSTNALLVFAENGGRMILAFRLFTVVFIGELILTWCWRNKEDKKALLLEASTILNLMSIVYVTAVRPYYPRLGGFTAILIPCTLIGIELCILYKQKPYYISCFVASLCLAFCIALSTNVGPNSFAAPLIIACTMLALFRHESRILQVFILVFACLLGWYKVSETFGKSSFEYSVKLEEGPLAGLYATEEEAHHYEERLRDTAIINDYDNEYIRVLSWNCWEYLVLDKKLAQGYTIPCFYTAEEYFAAEAVYRDYFPAKYPACFWVDDDNPFVKRVEDPNCAELELFDTVGTGWVWIIE